MSKGFIRSRSRGEPLLAPVIKTRVDIDATFYPRNGANRHWNEPLALLPEGFVLLHGAIAQLRFDGSGAPAALTAGWEGDFGIGTDVTLSAALSGDRVNIIPSTSIGAATARIATAVGTSSTQVILDATSGRSVFSLNLLVDAADISAQATIRVTGGLDMLISLLGDN